MRPAQLPSRSRLQKVITSPVSRNMAPGLSASATLKLVLLLASGISHQIVMMSPNPPAEKIARPNFFEKNVYAILRFVIVSCVSLVDHNAS